MATTPSTSIRLVGQLADRLTERGVPHATIIKRDLTRYYDALDSALTSANLSDADMDYLADILAGTYLQPILGNYLWAEVDDADPAYAERWGVDADALRDRLRTLPEFAALAIVDALERRRLACVPADQREGSIP